MQPRLRHCAPNHDLLNRPEAMSKVPAYELTDAEKRDLTQLIRAGKPLPNKYRFILFEDKREVELVWNGKTADVCTTVLPFQTLEHIDEPRKETKHQGELFDGRSRQLQGWTNKLIWGDNKLIYIDPPFDVGADFFHGYRDWRRDFSQGSEPAGADCLSGYLGARGGFFYCDDL